jgi:hypothetical protein
MKTIAEIIILLVCTVLLNGCIVGVESVGDAPVSHRYSGENESGSMDRLDTVVGNERETEFQEENKSWQAAGRPFPKGGWSPFWNYDAGENREFSDVE